jgi:hypothetical protein
MSPDANLSFEQLIELEEARSRERLSDLAEFKRLAIKLNIAVPGFTAAPSVLANGPLEADAVYIPAKLRAFDGTALGLIECYRTDKRSAYFQLKHKVRENYDSGFNRIIKDVGTEKISEWSADRIRTLYDENWAADGKVSMGRSLIAKLRLLASFGSTVLNDDDCIRLGALLSNMRFEPSKKKIERLTIEQSRLVRATAREHFGWESISLATAFQYELPMLWQIDIIGEWVPESEPGESEIKKDGLKWVGGIRWSEIDENMIFRPTITSYRKNQRADFDLKRFYSIMEEINRVPPWQRNGPVIRCETTGLPWVSSEFRRKWRKVADKAGLPKTVKMGGRSDAEPDEKPELRVVSTAL